MFGSVRKFLPAAALLACLACLGAGAWAGDAGFKDLFNGTSLDGWKTNVFGADDGATFTVKDGAIVVRGKPAGYFYTDKSYKNYVLRYDWKFIKDGNSGLLVHIQAHGKGWPKSLEIQGQQKNHGSVIDIGIKSEKKVDTKAQKEAIKIGEWNTTEFKIKDGAYSVAINGTPITTGQILSDDVKEGPFGFQSEGTELHFKNIKIKVLD